VEVCVKTIKAIQHDLTNEGNILNIRLLLRQVKTLKNCMPKSDFRAKKSTLNVESGFKLPEILVSKF